MKNINSLLKKTNLKPKERVLLFAHNAVSEEREGKSILSQADKFNLVEGWKPDSNEEIKEYNKYNDGWRLAGFAELDAQTTFLKAENDFLRASGFVDYIYFSDEKKLINNSEWLFKEIIKSINKDEAIELIVKNSGTEYNNAIYNLSFDILNLSEDFKKEMIEKMGDKLYNLKDKKEFEKYKEAKAEAEATINKLIEKGELKAEERIITFDHDKKIPNFPDREPEKIRIITGESLYNFKGDLEIAKCFKKQVDDFKGLGNLIIYLKSRDFIKYYAKLLAFAELFKRLSKVYEIDLNYKTDKWINDFRDDIKRLNDQLIYINDKLTDASWQKNNVVFLSETFIQEIMIKLEKVEPDLKALAVYFKEFERILGDDFKI